MRGWGRRMDSRLRGNDKQKVIGMTSETPEKRVMNIGGGKIFRNGG
jgi:hypothetical protein